MTESNIEGTNGVHAIDVNGNRFVYDVMLKMECCVSSPFLPDPNKPCLILQILGACRTEHVSPHLTSVSVYTPPSIRGNNEVGVTC